MAIPATIDEVLDPVLYEVADGVATITLNRPETLNAVNRAMATGFREALDRATNATDVVAIVITGAGRGFCSGADMSDLSASTDAPPEAEDPSFALRYGFMHQIDKPIIAAINGPCAGMGIAYAAYSDVRFASTDTVLVASFVRRGLTAELGLGWLLPRLVGIGPTLNMMLSGRKLGAEELRAIGFVSDVFAPDELLPRAQAFAADLAQQCSPAAMATIKRQIYDGLGESFTDAEEQSVRLMFASLKQPDFREGVDSFLEKRAPRFARLGTD